MRKKWGCLIFLMLMMASQIFAGNVYYIDGANGNDMNNGLSPEAAWKTIGKANDVLLEGDTVHIRAGTYSESISPKNSGQPSNYITYKNFGGEKIIIKNSYEGYVSNKDYIQIDGIEFDGQNLNQDTYAMQISGNYNIIQYCKVYNVKTAIGIIIWGGNYNHIHHNSIDYIGDLNGMGNGIQTDGNYNLIEENVIDHCGHEGISIHGKFNIIQKNILHNRSRRNISMRGNDVNVVQYNLIYDSGELDDSGMPNSGMECSQPRVIIRFNEYYNNNGWGIHFYCDGVHGIPSDAKFYHNVLYNNGLGGSSHPSVGEGIAATDSLAATGFHGLDIRNNINSGNYKSGIRWRDYADPNDHTVVNNHWDKDGDPLFQNEANHNFHLQSNSPCIDKGIYLTHTTSSGEGTQIPVEDAGYFCNGFGIVEGDLIQLEGQTQTSRIINVDYDNNIIIIDTPLTWHLGQGISFTYSGFAPDIGAYEYESADNLNVNINASPTSGEIPLTVNFTGSATGGTEPYTYSWNFGDSTSSSEQNPTHTYNDAGDYTVTLAVTDSQSNQDSNSLIINASAVITPLQASFIASPTSGEVPLTVNFTGNATGGVLPYSYNWNFGDSTSSTEQNPSHAYSQAGDYTVTLTVTDSQSNLNNDSLTINAYAPIIPLEASCTASPTLGEVPLTVNFTGSATGGTEPHTYSWDFGDGTSSIEQNPSHTYYEAGDYTVYLTVTDSQSNQDNDSLTINASAAAIPLEASCAASPTSGKVPLTVNFTGSATGGTEPYTYSWDFGDSTTSSEQNPTHTYSDAGDYTVAFTVIDSQSNQDEDSLIINVSVAAIPLEASCAASPTSGEVPLTVNFTGNASGGTPHYSYSWDFGDGTSSSEQIPTHTYSDAGDYTVTLTVTDSDSNQDNDSLIINASAATNSAYLSCSPKSIYFGATTSGNETTDQYLRIINAGSGTLTWNIEDDADWLSCSPSSGTDRGEITVSVNASGLSLGLYIATITVFSPEAYNSPQYVSVNFRVYEPEQESPPFGSLDTPVNGSTVSGSVPITGWALDDIEVIRVEIRRNSDPVDPPEAIGQDGLVYIGDAVFVEGARPDVEKSYPDYPLNSRAGWGYMLLTNDLPYRGNGSFTIYTFAYDAGGHREEIGRKTILCDNINRVKPFGTIDTPEQGEIIRGSDYVNFGWALTPLPKTIPKDGSTIWVWVDGVQVGHPVYDQYREDIATLYPEYNNAQGAVGYYYLDTTQYENGMHTISWSVMDDEGEVDEIGSRYFFIDNIEAASVHNGSLGLRSIYQEDVEGRLRIGIKEVGREYRPRVDSDRETDTKNILKIQIEEMEPVRIVLEESSSGNMEYIGWGENDWKALPVGSTLDREKGIFSWIPTPGFIGRYVLHFAVTDGSYMSKPLRVEVNVIPKRDRNKEN